VTEVAAPTGGGWSCDFEQVPPFGDNDVGVYIKADRFRELFAGDVPKNEVAAMEAGRRPVALAAG
jgi:hypothetical protein